MDRKRPIINAPNRLDSRDARDGDVAQAANCTIDVAADTLTSRCPCLLTGTDFFTVEVLTLRGLVTYYVLFFINLESRRVAIAGITVHPDEAWMKQMARKCGHGESSEFGVIQRCGCQSSAPTHKTPE